MRILLLAAGVAALAVTAPAFADLDDQGRGKGQENRGRGGGGGDDDDRGRGRGGDDDRGRGRGGDEDRGRGRGNDDDRGRGRDDRRFEDRGRDREARIIERAERRERRAERRSQRRAVRVENVEDVARLRWEPVRGLVNGCPPGLARKYNGCLPPGHARQRGRDPSWSNWWGYPDSTSYYYDEGYLYRAGDRGAITGFVPLLGGALWPGASWPQAFQPLPVADYHVDYFGLDDGLDYVLGDGAILGVDPTTQLIQAVAALVAGDEWAIGQPMPDGYGLYNVPYEYRDQYQDTADAWYRYSDGYVYQVDPTTQLIQAAIQLIT